MDTKVIVSFECRKELNSMGADRPTEMYSFYNKDGKYIGALEDFKRLVIDRGIEPETYNEHRVCSIGKSTRDGKWYGWSHRAIYGFTIGDKVKKGDCCASSGWVEGCEEYKNDPYILPVGFKAKTEEDCKKMAMAFASSVS